MRNAIVDVAERGRVALVLGVVERQPDLGLVARGQREAALERQRVTAAETLTSGEVLLVT